MRVFLPVLLSAISVFAEDPQAIVPAAPVPDRLTIPARLLKTIDTNKCKAGDAVVMNTVEPVLIADGLVMPQSAKLYGKILGAASRQDNKPSWVVLVVERAEWKQHSIPLHAFVVGQIAVKAEIVAENDNTFENAVNAPDTFMQRRGGQRAQTIPSNDLSTARSHLPRDVTVEQGDARQSVYRGVDDLYFLKSKSGTVFLVSNKPHLKLPSGAMFMLRNKPVTAEKSAQ